MHTSLWKGWALKDHGNGHVTLHHESTGWEVIKIRSEWEPALSAFHALPEAPRFLGAKDEPFMDGIAHTKHHMRTVDTQGQE